MPSLHLLLFGAGLLCAGFAAFYPPARGAKVHLGWLALAVTDLALAVPT